MSKCQPIFTIYQGDDVRQLMQLTQNGLPVDLTGVDEISVTLANVPDDDTPALILTKTGGGIVVSSATLGTFFLVIASAASANLLPRVASDLDVVLTNGSGKEQTFRSPNALTVLERAT